MGTPRDELVEALLNLSHAAKREFAKVGTPTLPTPWDRRHARINQLLDELQLVDYLNTITRAKESQ